MATTTYQRAVRKPPNNDKNSPMNPENPGSPIDAKPYVRYLREKLAPQVA